MTTTKDYYETYWSADGHCPTGAISQEVRRAFESVVNRDSVCLDVGCGDGRTAGLWLREHSKSYTGVDISSSAVEMAQSFGLDAICIDDAVHLPLADASFDVVVCLEVLEHLFDPQAAAREIARVLRPGGTLVATVPNVSHWKQRVDLAIRGRWDPRGDEQSLAEPWRDPHIRFFTPRALASMLMQSEFDHVTVKGRQSSFARNFRHLERFARPETGSLGQRMADRIPTLGAGLVAIATRSSAD